MQISPCPCLLFKQRENMSSSEQKTDSFWSKLPNELLALIGHCLSTDRIDVLRFRAVCPTWRSSIPPFSSSFPLTLPLPISPDLYGSTNKEIYVGHFTIAESILYRLEAASSSQGEENSDSLVSFLVWVQGEEQGPDSVRLVTPFDRCSSHDHTKYPRELNLLDFKVSEIYKAFKVVNKRYLNESKEHWSDPWDYYSIDIRDVLLLYSNPESKCYSVMLSFVHEYGRLSTCFLKQGDEEWTWINKTTPTLYSHFTTYKEKFYALTKDGSVTGFDSSGNTSQIASPILDYVWCYEAYFVKSLGGLLLVNRCFLNNNMGTRFKVYRLDEEENIWVEMESLDDQVLFVGISNPRLQFSISARDFSGCKGNFIYRMYNNDSYTWVCNFEDGSFQEVDRHVLWSH